MMRSSAKRQTGIFTLCFLCCMVCAISPSFGMGLKENSILSDNTIKLGDIFYDLPRDEGRILGTAPRPGQNLVLDARTLLKIAIALDLPWRPTSERDQVTLRREATVINYDQIKESLNTALYDEGIYGDFEVSIPAQHHEIILPADQPAEMAITNISIDAQRKSFKATIAAPSAANPIHTFTVDGRIEQVIRVPVLIENIQNGRIIKKTDIDFITIPESGFAHGTLIDADSLIGMTARRSLIAGRPVKDNEIIAPQIVDRGEMVIMSLSDGIMNITAQAKALESGAKGDVIRVVNTGSNRTLHARITGENEVTVLKN